MDNDVTYIEKKISCPSCKNGVEFAIKLNNVNLIDIKLNTKCSKCGTEIIFTPTSLIGIVTEQKLESKFIEESINNNNINNPLPNVISEEIEIEVPSDISAFFEEIDENVVPQETLEYNEMEENRKKRKYINDIFS